MSVSLGGSSWHTPPAAAALLTCTGSLLSSTGIREAERFGTPPGRASSITRAGKEENSGGIKYKAGRVGRSTCLPGGPPAWERKVFVSSGGGPMGQVTGAAGREALEATLKGPA